MKYLPFLLFFVFGTTALADDTASLVKGEGAVASRDLTAPAPEAPWNIVGTWDCIHTRWTGPITLEADGRIVTTSDLHGEWTLVAQQGHVQIILRWTQWAAETLDLTNGNEFYGKVENGEMRMHRSPPAPGSITTIPAKSGLGSLETRSWRQGEPPLKLIRRDEGFCVLTMVTGHFQGSGEKVRVYVGDDGYWHLGGTSLQDGVAAECLVVRYVK